MEQPALADVCSIHSLDVDRVCARVCVSLIGRTEMRSFLPVFQITRTTWQFNVSINMICTSDLCRNGSPWCFLALHCFIKYIDVSHIKRIQNSHPLMDCQRTNYPHLCHKKTFFCLHIEWGLLQVCVGLSVGTECRRKRLVGHLKKEEK